MLRAQITTRETPNRATVVYRLPVPLLAPTAGLWALVGGLAVGTGTTVGLTVAGVTVEGGGSALTFRAALLVLSAAAALALYMLIYLPSVVGRRLSVTFDLDSHTLAARLPHQPRRPVTHSIDDVIVFRLVDHDGCLLVMETTQGPVTLAATGRVCHRHELPALVGHLNGYLADGRTILDDIPDLPEDKL